MGLVHAVTQSINFTCLTRYRFENAGGEGKVHAHVAGNTPPVQRVRSKRETRDNAQRLTD